MFDFSFSELFVIVIVGLIVIGPERLPKTARFAAVAIRRARAQWQSVKSELEDELSSEELKRSLHQARDELNAARESLFQSGHEMQREFSEFGEAARDWSKPQAAAGTAEEASDASASEPSDEQSEGAYDKPTPEPCDAVDQAAIATRAGLDAQR
jgi:sec-independent protein translocase protein TatB